MPEDSSVIDIKKAVQARVETEAADLVDSTPTGEITEKFVLDCLRANERGDGLLYIALNRGKFLYNNAAQEWMHWTGHHWERDVMEHHHKAVEDVALKYLEVAYGMKDKIDRALQEENKDEAKRLEKTRDNLFTRVSKLRSASGCDNCIKFARKNIDPLAIHGREIDTKPWLLPVDNGVIDLKNGICSPGKPDDFLLKASPIKWKGLDAECPRFDRFQHEVFDSNEELCKYMDRLVGAGITGTTKEHVFPVLQGQGRNGKSVYVDIIRYVLGELAGPIESEMLLDQGRSKSSSGPSPDIMRLKGLRIAFASETDEGRKFSSARVKWLTGGDPLVGRNPHDKYPTEFDPTHMLWLLTNSKPHAHGDDFAFWERMQLIFFGLSFVNREPKAENERRADKGLTEALKEEGPGILAKFVRGCLAWQKEGLNPPAIVKEATADYRRDEDLISGFIEDCCEETADGSCGSTEAYKAFENWYRNEIGHKVPSQKVFGQLMGKKYERTKSGGKKIYRGLVIIDHGQSDFDGRDY